MKLNENLFNLGLDAHIKAAEIADNDPVGGYEGKIWQNIYRTKFAELIIRECADIVHDRILEIDIEFPGKGISNYLKEYFGIEE